MNGLIVLWFIIGIVLGLVGGFFFSRFLTKRELEKNPPLNETVVAEMMTQMGRKPSKKQLEAVMRTIRQQSDK
ncbi:MAG: YneF family protein [Culicoidibacterales bacterium]